MPRLALIFSVAALASLFGAASALACITQNPSAGLQGAEQGTPVHPGSRMAYSVAGLDIGAKYRVYVGDRPVTDELTKDSSEAKGTFTLGDYGSLPRSLPVWVNIDHPDAGTGHADPFTGNRPGLDVNYVPRSAPGTQDKPTPAPAVGDRPTAPAATTAPPEPARAPAGSQPAPATSAPSAGAPSRTPSRGNRATGRARIPTRVEVRQPARRAAAPPAAPIAAPTQTTDERAAAAALGTHPRGARLRQPVRHRAQPAARVLPLLRADDKAMARSALARQETATPSRPDSTWIVAGLALLTLFAGGLGWVALRVRRNPAPEADGAALEIEAELQEIIAEQRAEELTRREASGVAGPPG